MFANFGRDLYRGSDFYKVTCTQWSWSHIQNA